MKKVWIIMRKEWWDLRGQRALWLSFLLFPLVMVIASGSALAGSSSGGGIHVPISGLNSDPLLAGLTPDQIAQAIQGSASRTVFFLIPFVVSTILAAHSVAGEKVGRTLEPVLAAPLQTWQLLLAKSLTALIPTTLATWVAGAAFVILVNSMAMAPAEVPLILSPGWVAAMLIAVPAMGLIPIGITIIISSRVTDLRTAQQIGTLVGMVLGIAVIGISIAIPLTVLNVLGIALALLIAGAIILWFATRLFQREVILTRWA